MLDADRACVEIPYKLPTDHRVPVLRAERNDTSGSGLARSKCASADGKRAIRRFAGSELDVRHTMKNLLVQTRRNRRGASARLTRASASGSNLCCSSRRGRSQVRPDDERGPHGRSLDLLLDVGLPISVEVGRAQTSLDAILNLVPGSALTLDKKAEDPVGLRVNGKFVAHGEVLLVDDVYGIRMTQIVVGGVTAPAADWNWLARAAAGRDRPEATTDWSGRSGSFRSWWPCRRWCFSCLWPDPDALLGECP